MPCHHVFPEKRLDELMARMFLNPLSDIALVIEGGKLKQIHGRPCGACLRVR